MAAGTARKLTRSPGRLLAFLIASTLAGMRTVRNPSVPEQDHDLVAPTPDPGQSGGWKVDDAVHKFFPDRFEHAMTTHLREIADTVANLARAGTHVRVGMAVSPEVLGPGTTGDFQPGTGTLRVVDYRARMVGQLMNGELDGYPQYWPAALVALATAIHESAHGTGNRDPTIFAHQYNSWDHPSGEPGRYVNGGRAFREGMTELWAISKAAEVAVATGRPAAIATVAVETAASPQFVAAAETLIASVAAVGTTDGAAELQEVISRNASRDSLDILTQKLLRASGVSSPTEVQRARVMEAMLEPLGQLETNFAGQELTPETYGTWIVAGHQAGDAAMSSAMRVVSEVHREIATPASSLPIETKGAHAEGLDI